MIRTPTSTKQALTQTTMREKSMIGLKFLACACLAAFLMTGTVAMADENAEAEDAIETPAAAPDDRKELVGEPEIGDSEAAKLRRLLEGDGPWKKSGRLLDNGMAARGTSMYQNYADMFVLLCWDAHYSYRSPFPAYSRCDLGAQTCSCKVMIEKKDYWYPCTVSGMKELLNMSCAAAY